MTAAHDERVARARARVGSTLNGKYRLDRVVGVGGMAAVYATTHLRNTSRVAVKLLHREMAVDSNVRARFLREGYAANSVEHPGAVRILDDDMTEDGDVFLVMELLEGETLDARWERSGHRLGPREVARLMYQLLDVLATAHSKGIVHRDIKPENLFLTRDGVVKVLDFGVARMLEGPVTATRPGGIIGTPAFMAPEQVLDKIVDAQSDLWSVGATAFALLSKRYVHEAESAGEMMVAVGSRPARSLGLVAPDVPPALAMVVDRALMFNKADRWADARAMQFALADAYRETFGSPMPGTEEEEEDEDENTVMPPLGPAAQGTGVGRLSNRAAAAVTVLTGATPVIAEPFETPGPSEMSRAKALRTRSALLATGAVVSTIAIGIVVAMAAGGSNGTSASAGDHGHAGSSPSGTRQDGPGESSSAWRAPGTPARASEPPSFPVESLPTVWQPTAPGMAASASPPAPAVSALPPPSPPPHVAPSRPPPNCTPPFTIDPATSKRKWKMECL
jgi:serine/threonine protein kinase